LIFKLLILRIAMAGEDRTEIVGRRVHSKASEKYVDVVFRYPEDGDVEWRGAVPIEYRRTGVHAETPDEEQRILEAAYESMRPSKAEVWLRDQEEFWGRAHKEVTQAFFVAMKDSRWKCVNCELPKNPNWARRIQDMKEFGYTISTDTKMYCPTCRENTTHVILLRLPRGSQTGYETLSPALRKRILSILGNYDPFQDTTSASHLLPDHKFPEIRWDESTRTQNPDDMSDDEIRAKFQLLTNQRNEEKREICRRCFQTGKRGKPFGIQFFYEGDENWPDSVPAVGKEAEKGCIGCGWYDMKLWRTKLNEELFPL